MAAQQPKQQAPYPPQNAAFGGLPTVDLDVPITAVFMFLFILGAISHMTIFQVNKRRGHKFILSGMMFGFCMARITTCVMRIVWVRNIQKIYTSTTARECGYTDFGFQATRPTNIRVAMAAQIFVAAGVVLLFVINLLFAQRILRAAHPRSAWHPAFSWFFKILYIIIVASLVMLITSVVQSFYTLNQNTRRIDRSIMLYGSTYYTFISFLPILLVIGGLVIPRETRVEKFGSGRFRSKIAILLSASVLLCLGATFRCGTSYMTPRPISDPAWYHSKACFYIFNFAVEIIVIFLYIIVRVDRRFWVPNGSHAAGDYSRKETAERKLAGGSMHEGLENAILPEEEVFDDMSATEVESRTERKSADLEAGAAR